MNGCATYWNISGRTYNDVNSNCQKDAADTALYNMKINLSSGGNPVEQTYSGGAGYFSFNTPASGIYDVSGRLVASLNYIKQTEGMVQDIDITSLAPGSYRISLTTEKGNITKQFIRQ